MDAPQLDLELFKKRLIALRQELATATEIGRGGAETVELDQMRMGRLTRVDAIQAQAISVASKMRRDAQLRQIDAALARIDEDHYGQCADCGEHIDVRRLEFDPTALLCIACAKRAEQS